MMVKIAVYTIALNEENYVKRWFESARDADLLLIADTGSKDKTVSLARSLGIKVYSVEVDPWRFDIARNASLALVPSDFDICIQLDMDETLPFNWRSKVEAAWSEGNNWPIYRHVTTRFPDGRARTYQHYFKIHPRNGFVWKYPIHEIVVPQPGVNFTRREIDLEVDHRKDWTKSRSSYLALLEMGAQEMPTDWRMNHYLCREYWYAKNWKSTYDSGLRTLALGEGIDYERASTAIWVSEAALNLGFRDLAEKFARQATIEAPAFYESWHWLSHIAYLKADWNLCLDAALKIESLLRQQHHLVKTEVWEWWGFDLIAIAAHNMGKNDLAIHYGRKALRALPEDQRLKNNLSFYRAGILSNERVLIEPPAHHSDFFSQTKIFVINLSHRLDRLGEMQQELPFAFQSIEAFDGKVLIERLKNKEFTEKQSALYRGLALFPVNPPDRLSGIFGQWMSHITVWNNIVSSSFNENYFMILEDDVRLNIQFEKFDFNFLLTKESQPVITSLGQELQFAKTYTSPISDKNQARGISEYAYLLTRSAAVLLLNALDSDLSIEAPVPPLRTWISIKSYMLKITGSHHEIFTSPQDSPDSDIRAITK